MRPGIVIAEFGAGTGSITKELMKKLPEGSTLLVFENNRILAAKLREDLDAYDGSGNVILIEDDAANLVKHLDRLGLSQVDYVVSGLPIGNFDHRARQKIFDAIYSGMKNDGVYIQFQYLLASWLHVREVFNARIIGYEIRNIPPAFVYECRKR